MPTSVIVREQAGISLQGGSSDEIARIYLFTTSDITDATRVNRPIYVSPDEFRTFAEYPRQTVDDLYGIYLNAPNTQVWIVHCYSETEEGEADPVVSLEAGIEAVSLDDTLENGIILVPQLADPNDLGGDESVSSRTTLQSRIDNMAKDRHWMFFLNAPFGIQERVVEEVARYTSELGHTSYYGGFLIYTDPQGDEERRSSVAALAAATATKATTAEGASQSPAGVGYALVTPDEVTNYVFSKSQFDLLKELGVNVVLFKKTYGYCIWGARTLSKNARFQWINTRQCINQVALTLEERLTPYLLDPIDPQGRTTAEIVMISTSVMEDAFENNYLTGESASAAYSVTQLPLGEDGVIKIEIVGNFVNSVETIEITLINGEVQNGNL